MLRLAHPETLDDATEGSSVRLATQGPPVCCVPTVPWGQEGAEGLGHCTSSLGNGGTHQDQQAPLADPPPTHFWVLECGWDTGADLLGP